MIEAAVGLGANLGAPEAAFARARRELASTPGVIVRAASSVWRTAPWGVVDQPDFLNGVLILDTSLTPERLLEVLQDIEASEGRKRQEKWGPRVLDLDLLWVGREVRDTPELSLPHPLLSERSFVLEPAAEVAPRWMHPHTGLSIERMRQALHGSREWTACTKIPDSRVGLSLPVSTCPS